MSTQQYSAYNAQEPEHEGPGPIGYLALVLAWAVPGLGHMMVGEKLRGAIFMVTIHGLFAGGLLIGGIRAINPPDQAIWTYTQFLTGWPMLVANRVERDQFEPRYMQDPADRSKMIPKYSEYEQKAGAHNIRLDNLSQEKPEDREKRQQFTRDFIAANPLFAYHPKVQDLGAVYCGIAGMLNLLVMFDVLLRVTGSVREQPAAKKSSSTPAPAAKAEAAA